MGNRTYFLAHCAIVLYGSTLCTYSSPKDHLGEYALIRSPVADLFNTATITSGTTKNYMLRNRIHQALFNELYKVEKVTATMVQIRVDWAVYGYDRLKKPQNLYWVQKKDILFLKTIQNKKYAQELIKTLPAYAPQQHRITLKRPFTDEHDITYSIGTQFVTTHHHYDKIMNSEYYTVIYGDFKKGTILTAHIPASYVIENTPKMYEDPRTAFVQLVTEFVCEIAQQKIYTTIPYLWGGGSFTHASPDTFIQDDTGVYRQEKIAEPLIVEALSGYDCSLLVLRFARMAGIPYIFKTTAMLEKYGNKCTDVDQIQQGDLIWLEGHMAIITDMRKKLITEAAGYENGAGKVHTIPLNKLLKNIDGWDDLMKAYSMKKSVIRLDAQGNDFKRSPVKIFKLYNDAAQ